MKASITVLSPPYAPRGYEVISIQEKHQGISDREVLEVAKQSNALLVTEDSDFGELVFSYHEKSVGVIFLRFVADDLAAITTSLLTVLQRPTPDLHRKFVVISPHKIRIRDI
jgi:predicted nuclease of predicted toxin-antitoxin system